MHIWTTEYRPVTYVSCFYRTPLIPYELTLSAQSWFSPINLHSKLHVHAMRPSTLAARAPSHCRHRPATGVRAQLQTVNTSGPAAAVAEFPDPVYCQAVLARVPGQGVCTAEEGRVLYANGYAFLDVRSELELESEGRLLGVKGVVHVSGYGLAVASQLSRRN